MRITQLRFGGFKSLRDVTCHLDQLTVITGPNGAGKSNLVDAINLLSECFQYDLEIAVARAGGYTNIAYRGVDLGSQQITCVVSLEFNGNESRLRSRLRSHRSGAEVDSAPFVMFYRFSLEADEAEGSEFSVTEEYIELRDQGGLVLKVERNQSNLKFWRAKRMKSRRSLYGDLLYPLSEDAFIEFAKQRVESTSLVMLSLQFGGGGIFELIRRQLGDARVFQLSPNQVRQAGVSTPNARLDRHGENLPAVADFLRKNKRDSWAKIEAAMQTILPQLESIDTTFTTDRRLALQFKERDLDRPWNSNEMSDGTVQTLALFVALFDTRSPVLIVEEPENALHPWILRHFLSECREQSDKQIVLTTHSPVLLDLMSPENIRLIWSKGGESHLAHINELNPRVVDMWKSGDLRTFEIYDSGIVSEYLPEIYLSESECK
ncbi:AAA family ATPase [Rhodococcus sp. (in: high G+C Gram-positive bacteria)]|uniref:AAA family ATPase n=1 Tax=Rhodococcus sp. TaxID=1831 RepID=UPI00257A3ECE|nr:AAA family ATPase [Rhodococcus sp. (in: high G+C Gram-positive bacteria)]MBQ7803063.1 AAA family ATPase [Rhodococcus sp. (in: high G+C Gram-positive bacteria)]